MKLAVPIRLASVSFLNARPLIYGLERDPGVSLELDVPSGLLDRLRNSACDVALLPVIDYQRLSDARIIPAGGIGSDGPTLTVRIFARRPIEQISTVACDPDSHTSVALARIILAERHGIRPEFIARKSPLPGVPGRGDEAHLLIGDKVVCEEPQGYPHQYDLGDEWKQLTGLPFVFAVWTARADVVLGDLPQRLKHAKEEGLRHVDALIEQYAIPRGWPASLARQYLTKNLRFDIGQPQIRAIERFHALAAKHGIIERVRPLLVEA